MDDNNTPQGNDDLGANDPMYPNGDNGTGDFPSTTGDTPNAEAPSNDEPQDIQDTPPVVDAPESVTQNIAERLGGQGEEVKPEGGINPVDTFPFDITKMSREQLQALKSMLAATPEGHEKKTRKPVIHLRRIEGKIVIDFKNAYTGLVQDRENRREVERHLIPIRFNGEEEFKPIMYADFINSERVRCEVISHKEEKDPIVEGETISRETGLPVEMVRNEIKHWFTVKLPDGSEVDIEGRLANA